MDLAVVRTPTPNTHWLLPASILKTACRFLNLRDVFIGVPSTCRHWYIATQNLAGENYPLWYEAPFMRYIIQGVPVVREIAQPVNQRIANVAFSGNLAFGLDERSHEVFECDLTAEPTPTWQRKPWKELSSVKGESRGIFVTASRGCILGEKSIRISDRQTGALIKALPSAGYIRIQGFSDAIVNKAAAALTPQGNLFFGDDSCGLFYLNINDDDPTVHTVTTFPGNAILCKIVASSKRVVARCFQRPAHIRHDPYDLAWFLDAADGRLIYSMDLKSHDFVLMDNFLCYPSNPTAYNLNGIGSKTLTHPLPSGIPHAISDSLCVSFQEGHPDSDFAAKKEYFGDDLIVKPRPTKLVFTAGAVTKSVEVRLRHCGSIDSIHKIGDNTLAVNAEGHVSLVRFELPQPTHALANAATKKNNWQLSQLG